MLLEVSPGWRYYSYLLQILISMAVDIVTYLTSIQTLDRRWNCLETDEFKASNDLARFLLEKLHSPGFRGGEVIVLKKYEGSDLHKLNLLCNLFYESVDAPMKPNGTRPDFEEWIVIGLVRAKVDEEVQRIRRECSRVRQSALAVATRLTTALHEAVVIKARSSVRLGEWDISGTWTVRCPKVESKFNVGMSGQKDLIDLTLTTRFFNQSSSRFEKLYAYYDFNITEGLFPLMRVTPWPFKVGDEAKFPKEAANGSQTVIHDEDEKEDDEDEEGGEEEEPPCAQQIYFHPFCSMSFAGKCCTELTGVLWSHFTGWVNFTGLKTGPSELNPPADGWESSDDE